MFKYDVSVIVPVYNNEKYIVECIQSILNQNYDTKKIQIVIINDGSTDKTGKVCKKISEKYSNILLINKENAGVSEARNSGMKKAEGKYILFLDSDDKLEENSLKKLIDFFDEHYDEIDLVTYPMLIYENEKAKPKKHYRYKFYNNGTGIYDLEENPYLGQSTINIIIKNEKNDRVLFDKQMDYSEDEAFNTTILMKKKKIGFCKEAIYIYKKNAGSVTKNKSNPYYTFESLTRYNEKLIEKFHDENGKIPKYIQAIILNNFRWRIKSDEVFPYHYEKKKLEQAIGRIKNILKYIDIDCIMNMPNMDKFHKFFVINLRGTDIDTKIDENGFEIYADSIEVEKANKIAMRINKIKCKNGKIEFLGYIRSIILLYKEAKLFYVIKNQNGEQIRKQLTLFNSNHSRYGTKMEVTKIYGFDLEMDLSDITELYFEVEIDNQIFNVNYEFSNVTPINKLFRSFIYDKKVISINKKEGKFKFRKATFIRKLKIELKKAYILWKDYKTKAIIYRLCSKVYSKRKIWLYCDRDGLFENSYFQFMHDIKKDDHIYRYYVYDDNFKEIKDKFEGVKPNKLVKYGSIKHKLLYLASSKVLTSFQAPSYYNPLGKNMKSYVDILKYDLVYLQHGVLHCHTPWIFSNEKNEIEKVVVSSQYEVNNFIQNYNYFEKNLIKSGMPRLDFINVESKGQNKIVFAPTWRKHLIGELQNNRRILKTKQFMESSYYKKIDELINSQKLINVLEQNNFIFEFKIHPVFRDYVKLFKSKSKNIIINADSINLDEYKLFITDYSSFVFDYVYLKRPIIYFLPDELEFNAGLHIYRKLDLPIEEGFGPISRTSNELVDLITKVIDNNFELEPKYSNIMDNFFISNKDDHREKLYEALIEEN